MKFITAISFLAVASIGVQAAPTSVDVKPRPVLHWKGPVIQGGPEVRLNGTADAIYEQILKLNPNYDHDLGIHRRDMGTSPNVNVIEMKKREEPNWARLSCHPPGVITDTDRISRGIDHLRRIGGSCWAPRGPGGCATCYCERGDAIVLCNDTNHDVWQPCWWVADYAQGIKDRCHKESFLPGTCIGLPMKCSDGAWIDTMKGQMFAYDGNTNILIKQAC